MKEFYSKVYLIDEVQFFKPKDIDNLVKLADTYNRLIFCYGLQEYRKAAVDAVKQLSEDVGIVSSLKGVVKEEDVHALAVDAFNDACRPGNPRETSVEEIEALYRSLM